MFEWKILRNENESSNLFRAHNHSCNESNGVQMVNDAHTQIDIHKMIAMRCDAQVRQHDVMLVGTRVVKDRELAVPNFEFVVDV